MFFQEKKEEEWTDEERRGAAEYQKKVKELEEEREKFRKVAPLRYSSYLFCIACCHIDTLLYSTHTGTFFETEDNNQRSKCLHISLGDSSTF